MSTKSTFRPNGKCPACRRILLADTIQLLVKRAERHLKNCPEIPKAVQQ